MHKTYITGSAVVSALGETKYDAIRHMKKINNNNYAAYLKSVCSRFSFYAIADFEDKKRRFFTMIKKVIFDALHDADMEPDEYSKIPVFIGSTSMIISVSEQQWKEEGCLKDLGSGTISRYIDKLLDSETTATIFSTACTSSANALIFASDEIKAGNIDKALVLGIELFNDATYEGFKSLMLLSESGVYHPLSPKSDGIVLGEGCSAIVLSPAAKKKNDFVILGSQDIFDNYSETSSNPNGQAIYESISFALRKSNLQVKDLSLINIHSPGTEVSNEAETNALAQILKHNKRETMLCSMKPYIGHTLGACSTNELVLLTSAVQSGFIPETLGISGENGFLYSNLQEVKQCKTNILFTYNGFSGNNFSFVVSNQVT